MELIKFEFVENTIKVIVDPRVAYIIPKDEFPLKFKVEEWVNNNLIWECDIYEGHWASYGELNFKNFSIYTKSNKLIKKYEFSPYMSVGDIEEFFYLWVGSRERTNGIVLGAGTGLWGEWVHQTLNYNCNVVLVEGDPNNIEKLESVFKDKVNVIIEPIVVSPKGGKVKFWIAPFGLVSSMDRENVKKFLPDSEPECIEVESKSVTELMTKHFPDKIDWLRIDLEGIDYDVIMNIDDSMLQKLSMIIYENMNITDNQIEEINSKLIRNGYSIHVFGIDTVAVK